MDTTIPADHRQRLLRRCVVDHMLGGVAAGTADFLGVDVGAVRVALVVLAAVGGIGVPLYLAAWLLVPAEDAATSIGEQLIRRYGPTLVQGS